MLYDYNKFYKKYPVNQHDLTLNHSSRHAMIASLCLGKVLDIGCGTGNLADYFFGDYTGLDISDVAIENAKKIRRKDASFFVRDCSDLSNFDLSSFDTIILSEFLEHLESDDKIFNAIPKSAKKDARLIITVPNGDRIPDESHLRIFTVPDLRKKLSPFGKVKFYNWPGAIGQILCTVDLGQKNDNLVSLVMVVKDEENGLERAILSCIDFVDNIVISVDSKSTDKTLKIAKLYADTLKSHIFEDDFSKLRNDAHQGVKTKWILVLDGHEFVSKKAELEKYLTSSLDGLLVPVELENGFIFHYPRIYRNGFYFEGKVHERVSCKKTQYYPGFLIKHGRLGVQASEAILFRRKQADEMIPRILEAELKKNPENIRAHFHLGLFYQSNGNFKKALFYYSQYLKYSKNSQERWFILFHRSLCLLALGRLFLAFHSACLAESEVPGRWEIPRLKGLIFFQKRKYAKALEYFVNSFKNYQGVVLYRPWPRKLDYTWNLIGECFYHLRNYEKAFHAFSRAAQLCENEDAKKFLNDRAKLMYDIFRDSLKSY